MKHYIGYTDAAAAVGVISSVLKVVPEIIGAIAGLMAIIYYSFLIYDRLKKRDTPSHDHVHRI